MVDRATLEVEARDKTGKINVRKIRLAGKVPGIVYGQGSEPIAISLDPAKLRNVYKTESGRNVLLDLNISGKHVTVLSHELVFDPLTRLLVHIDFLLVDLKKEVHQHVPLLLQGIAPGIKAGGILEQSANTVQVACLPEKIPNKLVLDVSDLELGESRHASDLVLPEGVRLTSPAGLVLVRVAEPRAEKVEETAAATPVAGAEGAAAPGATPAAGAADAKKEPAAAKGKEAAPAKGKEAAGGKGK